MADELRQLLANELANNLTHAIASMTGEQPTVALSSNDPAPPSDFLSWKQRFNVSSGSAWLCAPAATWTSIGQRSLKAAGIEDEDPAMARSTFVEILGQAFSMLARSISSRAQKEWSCLEGSELPGPGKGDHWTGVSLQFGDGETAQLAVRFEDALMRALEPSSDNTPAPATRAAPPAVVQPEAPAQPRSQTLDLLMDVELPVSVSFGRAQLPLKDVIKLTTGSIVELNRTIMEPVEVIVNNCVIARGEVVVVEGNFGVRIEQVVSREERLRTLF